MSNVLFVLYHDFSANSAVHVHNFANHLTTFGHETAVAMPEGEDTGGGLGEQHYAVRRFADIDGDWSAIFANGQPPEIVHAWTPRENVRLFCEKLAGLCRFRLFIHLEDNEELILEANFGQPFAALERDLTSKFANNLAHPRRYAAFIASADGVTMIMDRLAKFVPATSPQLVLWPGADTALFFPRPRDENFLASLGIKPGTIVLCYTGNAHSANARDVRSLYLAAAILNREGTPTKLLRTGRDFCTFLGPDEGWARDISIDLGHVDYQKIPALLSLADVLIQPGGGNAFNEYRLPGKLPEFFAMGIPVILPNTNAGRFMRHGEDAWVLPKVDAITCATAVKALQTAPHLHARLGAGALEFSARRFDWQKNTATLSQFYEEVIAGKTNGANLHA